MHQVSTLVYRLGTGIAKDIHATKFFEIVEKRVGDDVIGLGKVATEAAVKGGNLFWRDWEGASFRLQIRASLS